ncbi:MAG: hypothetical protein D6727_06575 [Gammaproteobacteria bacterium]|nr:MAG: hypothetical protein D6727_06575 [Gammaproteobacteria bacterium]
MYRFKRSAKPPRNGRQAHLFGSGAIMAEVLRAADLLASAGIAADVWSVTSYNELHRDALRKIRRRNLHQTAAVGEVPWVESVLAGEDGVFVAASDYMKALPLSIARWVPGPYVVLGTDGYGLSESRADLRDWFEVSAEYIAWSAAAALAAEDRVSAGELAELARRWKIRPDKPDAAISGPADLQRD